MAIWSANFKRLLTSSVGSASVEFVLLALPLFIPILIFLNQFATLSNSELVVRSLVRESLRAYVTSDNPYIASYRAQQVLVKGGEVAGLTQSEIDSLDLDFECSKDPCLSPGGRIRAVLKLQIPNQNRTVRAEAQEYLSPWQWNGAFNYHLPNMEIDR